MRFQGRATAFSVSLVLAVCLGLILVPCTPAFGKKKNNAPSPGNQNVVISAVDAAQQAIIITDKDKKTATYTVTTFTQVTVEGKAGTFSDLKAGQLVLSFVEGSSSSLDSIDVSASSGTSDTSTPATPAKKKKKPAQATQ